MSRILKRQGTGEERLNSDILSSLGKLFDLLSESLVHMDEVLKNPEAFHGNDDRARVKEMCKDLRENNFVQSGAHAYSYAVSSIYNDLINEGDVLSGFIENVEEARTGGKERDRI